METNQSERAVRIGKLLYWGVNFLLMFPILIRNISLFGIIGAGAVLMVLLCCMVFFSKTSVPASAYLPLLLFSDICVCACLQYEALVKHFDPGRFVQILELYQQNIPCAGLAVLGLAVGAAGVWKRPLSWLTGVAGGTVGVSIILLFWSNNRWENLQLYPSGKILLAAFLPAVLVWMLAFEISRLTAPQKLGQNIFWGLLLLCAAAVFLVSEVSYFRPLLPGVSQGLLDLPHTVFAWKNVALICIILLMTAAACFRNQEKGPGVDALVPAILAVLIFSIKFLMSNYFLGCSVLLLAQVFSMLRCLRNESCGKKTLGLPSAVYLAAQAAAFLLAAKAFQYGLYANVLLAVVFGAVLYLQQENLTFKTHGTLLSVVLLTFFVSEALAWQWKIRSSPEGTVILAMILLMSLASLLIISGRHSEQQRTRGSLYICLCACTLLLCLASMRPTISVTVETREREAAISITAQNGQPVKEAAYYWSDYPGQKVEDERTLAQLSAAIPIQGNILTVIAADSSGVRTSRVFWYPPWLY